MKKKIIISIYAIVLFYGYNVNATTHTVTSTADAGNGSLRQRITSAISGDTINFASDIDFVTLTSEEIKFSKNLTINGGTENKKVTISGNNNSRIFYLDGNYTFNINNCNIIDGTIKEGQGGAVYIYEGNLITTNCSFNNNKTTKYGDIFTTGCGGAIYVFIGNFTATNCDFTNNTAKTMGGAVCIDNSKFSATNCSFSNNKTDSIGGAVCVDNGSFTPTNCSFNNNDVSGAGKITGEGGAVGLTFSNFYPTNCHFSNNTATKGIGGAVVMISSPSTIISCLFNCNSARDGGAFYSIGVCDNIGAPPPNDRVHIYHSTFVNNIASNSGAGFYLDSDFYIYNSIITGNRARGSVSNAGQIKNAKLEGKILGGTNLIHNGTTDTNVNNQRVFGTNNCHLIPLNFAMNAPILTTENIESHPTIDKADVISKLAIDIKGNLRPTTGNVTYGAIESNTIPQSQYTITLSSNSNVGIAKEIGKYTGSDVCDCVDFIIISAVPNDCYSFIHWTDSTGKIISTKQIDTIKLNSDSLLIAVFDDERNSHIITISTYLSYMGTITGGNSGLYYCDDELTLIAKPSDTLYKFVNWTAGGQYGSQIVLSDKDTITILIKSDTNIRANFNAVGIVEEDIYDISIVPNPVENDFNIIFDNIEDQHIAVKLIDLSGKKIFDIYDGFAEAKKQIYKVDKKLVSGTYFVKFIIKGKTIIRKVIVN